jgi:FkbM family methyltransferase
MSQNNMHPINQESFIKKVILKIHRITNYKLLNWYKLGEVQQAWYLKKLFKLCEIDLVIDAGGNTGQYATFLRRKVGYKGKILTIEPMQFAVDALVEKFKYDKNWSLEYCAISDTNTVSEFNILSGNQMSSLLKPSSSSTEILKGLQSIVEKTMVKVKTLDNIFESNEYCKSAKNIYLKLDIQGKELEALNGCKDNLYKIVAMQAELNVIPIYEGIHKYYDLMKVIEELGFILSFLPAHAYRFFPDIVDFDAHFVSKSKMQEKGYLENAI